MAPVIRLASVMFVAFVFINSPAAAQEEKDTVAFTIVEESASPIRGMYSFYQHCAEVLKYPMKARRKGVQGTVYVEFVVEKDGKITNAKAIRDIGAGCGEEAVRAVLSAPPWNPGRIEGKPVRQIYTLPIIFKLGTSK